MGGPDGRPRSSAAGTQHLEIDQLSDELRVEVQLPLSGDRAEGFAHRPAVEVGQRGQQLAGQTERIVRVVGYRQRRFRGGAVDYEIPDLQP